MWRLKKKKNHLIIEPYCLTTPNSNFTKKEKSNLYQMFEILFIFIFLHN